jgi:small-conductance mechanosensitive channel
VIKKGANQLRVSLLLNYFLMNTASKRRMISYPWRELGLLLLKVVLALGLIGLTTIEPAWWQSLSIPVRYLDALLLFLVAQVVIHLLRMTIITVYTRRRRLPHGIVDNFILGINQIASIAVFLAFLISALLVLNIDIREALTAISIVAAAIAILSKDYVSNMINGMILMFSSHISLYDQIRIGEQRGRIVDITLMNIHLVNDDDDLIYIPNNAVLTEEVVNYTKRKVKKVSIEFEMSYVHLQQLDELEAYLQACLAEFSHYIMPGSYNLKVVEIRKGSAQLKLQYVLRGESKKEVERQIRRMTVRKVIEYVNREKKEAKPG